MIEIDTDRIHVTVNAGDLRAALDPKVSGEKKFLAIVALKRQLEKTVDDTLFYAGFSRAVLEEYGRRDA